MSGTPAPTRISINRAPVLTLWAAVVAERLGHPRAAALTLGRAVAGVNARSKGLALGIFEKPTPQQQARQRREEKRAETIEIQLLGRVIRAKRTKGGLRALERGRAANPEVVARYLESKFGDALGAAREAMTELAHAMPPEQLADRAFELYERFRPNIPGGVRGWGVVGELDLARVRALAKPARDSRAVKPPDGPASARGAAKRGTGGMRASPAPRARAPRRAAGPAPARMKRRA
jgi:hypothetical protein